MNRSHWLTPMSLGLAAAALIAAVGCGSPSAERSSASNPPATAESARPAEAQPAAPEAHPTEARDRDLDRPATEPEAAPSQAVRALVERLLQQCGGLLPRTVAGDAGLEARFRQHRLFL